MFDSGLWNVFFSENLKEVENYLIETTSYPDQSPVNVSVDREARHSAPHHPYIQSNMHMHRQYLYAYPPLVIHMMGLWICMDTNIFARLLR